MILEKDSEYQLKQLKEGSFEYSNDRTRAHLDMVEMFNRAEDEILYTNNRVKVYNEGESKFKDLFDDLRQAKHTIYVQYYIYKSDGLSTEFTNILKEKAREGLDVYLLIDGMGIRLSLIHI